MWLLQRDWLVYECGRRTASAEPIRSGVAAVKRGPAGVDDLARLAELIGARNAVARDIAGLIGRPAQIGHVGEYIASRVFGIALEESAARKGVDGRFAEGPLVDRSVNVKWYAKQGGVLDLTPEALPDFYLVLAGPRSPAGSSRGTVRLWTIQSVHLFESRELVEPLRARGVKMGTATSVARELWEAAEVYPNQRSPWLAVSDEQRRMLRLFG